MVNTNVLQFIASQIFDTLEPNLKKELFVLKNKGLRFVVIANPLKIAKGSYYLLQQKST